MEINLCESLHLYCFLLHHNDKLYYLDYQRFHFISFNFSSHSRLQHDSFICCGLYQTNVSSREEDMQVSTSQQLYGISLQHCSLTQFTDSVCSCNSDKNISPGKPSQDLCIDEKCATFKWINMIYCNI